MRQKKQQNEKNVSCDNESNDDVAFKPPLNLTLFQFFHWYFPPEDDLWNTCSRQAKRLADLGVTHLWLPPAYKSSKKDEPGYAVYDLYDLGEFDQKGSVKTKHGTRKEYLKCIDVLKKAGIAVIADVVINHKFEGDVQEIISVVEVSERNRNRTVSGLQKISANTGFTFPGRKGMYSRFEWNFTHFTGLCHKGKPKLIQNDYTKSGWSKDTSKENGSFDFLMANDIEFRNPEVRKELMRWGDWYVDSTGVDGFRLDGLKHITADFFPQWLDYLNVVKEKEFFVVGEYWDTKLKLLVNFVHDTGKRIRLFDVPLHFNFHKASTSSSYDIRNIFKNTLTAELPESAVTFVDNHDTQPLQSLRSYVEEWFQPHAHALILLRASGMPCVFYPAVFGASYSGNNKSGEVEEVYLRSLPVIRILMRIRNKHAYGEQIDYFESRHLIGWLRKGLPDKKGTGCVVLLSTKKDGSLTMVPGKQFAGLSFYDVTGNRSEKILIDRYGKAKFFVNARSVSVWILAP